MKNCSDLGTEFKRILSACGRDQSRNSMCDPDQKRMFSRGIVRLLTFAWVAWRSCAYLFANSHAAEAFARLACKYGGESTNRRGKVACVNLRSRVLIVRSPASIRAVLCVGRLEVNFTFAHDDAAKSAFASQELSEKGEGFALSGMGSVAGQVGRRKIYIQKAKGFCRAA
jgi:hypothetical protein